MSMLRRGAARVLSSASRSLPRTPVLSSSSPVASSPSPVLASLPHDAPPAAATSLLLSLHLNSPLSRSSPFSSVAASPPSGVVAPNKELQAEIEHATGLEKEELIGEAEGKPRFDLAPPRGPFGTTDAPAIVESYFDERIVGCSGDDGDDEHDVVWFKLKKDVGHTCSVCGQVFQLKVVGEGGPPGGHH